MHALHRLWPVLASTALMVLGHGLVGSLVPLQIVQAGGSEASVGLMGTAYYAGLTLGSFRVGPHLARVGHQRAFSALTSIATATVLVLMVTSDFASWLLARFVFGVAIGGMYVVIESWLSAGSTPRQRGQMLAAYLITVYGGLSIGQWFVAVPDPSGVTRMVLAAGLMAVASVPLVDTDHVAPTVMSDFRIRPRQVLHHAPAGVLASLVAGLLAGAVFGVAPAFAARVGLAPIEISAFMSAFVVGGMLLQWPMGRASDTYDRRMVLAFAAGLAGLGSALSLAVTWSASALGLAALVTGGGVFSIYAIAVAYTLDRVDPEDSLSANATLLLLYCGGSALGSAGAAVALDALGPTGFFLTLLVPSLLLVGYATMLATVNRAAEDKHTTLYAPRTSPHALGLHPDFPSVDAVVDEVSPTTSWSPEPTGQEPDPVDDRPEPADADQTGR